MAIACQQAVHFIGMPEGFLRDGRMLPLSGARAEEQQRRHGPTVAHSRMPGERRTCPVPLHLRNAATGLMKEFGYGQGYRYAHDEPGHVARGMRYLPEELGRPQYYVPGELGFEADAATRLRGFGPMTPTIFLIRVNHMKIEFLYSKATGRAAAAEEALRLALEATDPTIEVIYTEVDGSEDAKRQEVPGVALNPRERDRRGIRRSRTGRVPGGTRYYNTPEGWKPYPHARLIANTILELHRRAKRREVPASAPVGEGLDAFQVADVVVACKDQGGRRGRGRPR